MFKLKKLGCLKYFLVLELARSSDGLFVSQRQYTFQLLEDNVYLACKPTVLPMDPSIKMKATDRKLLDDPFTYRILIGRLLYLTISRDQTSCLLPINSTNV